MEKHDTSERSTSDQEKHMEGTHEDRLNKENPDPDAHLSDAERAAIDRKLVRKLDRIIIPWLCLLYLASFLDRTNIGNAKIDGLQKDLNMTSNQYNLTLTIFFISYSVFEPATQIMLKKFRPSIFLPIIMILWGIVMTTMGLVHNFSGLMAARWFLGITEAGLFPGVNYYLSAWYKRRELGIRAAVFFSAAALAGSFGGLLAAAINKMKGVGGKPGWAWIFILEGLATVIIGAASFYFVHDFPDEATFLSDEDRRRVIRRLKLDNQSSAEHEEFKMEYFWATLKDWKTYCYMIIYMGCDGALYAFSLFIPTIIAGLGYKSTEAQLLTVPPYAAAAIATITIGFVADKTGQRGYCNMGCGCLGIVGFIMLISTGKSGVQYAGLFLGAMGIYPCIANTIVWAANNTEGVYKRGITMGFVIGWGNLNGRVPDWASGILTFNMLMLLGIVSSNIYRAADKPRYLPGHGVVLGYLGVFLVGGSLITHLLLRAENTKRRNGQRDIWIQGKTEQEIAKLGDQRPDFIYTT